MLHASFHDFLGLLRVRGQVLITIYQLMTIIWNFCLTFSKSGSNVHNMIQIDADLPTPLRHMRGIEKIFPGVKALDGVDLDVRAGEVHCLLGQNGAGKSTMIKVLAGAHRHDGGTIEWMGEEVKQIGRASCRERGKRAGGNMER